MGYDVVSKIIQYETEGLSPQQEAKLYRHLLKTGVIYSLQGTYQRRCQELIDNGTIKLLYAWKALAEETTRKAYARVRSLTVTTCQNLNNQQEETSHYGWKS